MGSGIIFIVIGIFNLKEKLVIIIHIKGKFVREFLLKKNIRQGMASHARLVVIDP